MIGQNVLPVRLVSEDIKSLRSCRTFVQQIKKFLAFSSAASSAFIGDDF